MFKRAKQEEVLIKKLQALFPEHELIELHYAVPPELVQYFPVPIEVETKYNLKPDIVICARNRQTMGKFGDKGVRNYQQWPLIFDSLIKKGYKVGIIGKKETSYDHPSGGIIRSWKYKDNTGAIMEMLAKSRLYIGTDTGPTHLATLLKTPMILFRNEHEKLSPNMLKRSILPIAKKQHLYAELVPNGWDKPSEVVKSAINYLSGITT